MPDTVLSSENTAEDGDPCPASGSQAGETHKGPAGHGRPARLRSTPAHKEAGSAQVMLGFPFPRMGFCVILTYLQIINPRVKKSYPSASAETEIRFLKKGN